jgi:hypothetical protein
LRRTSAPPAGVSPILWSSSQISMPASLPRMASVPYSRSISVVIDDGGGGAGGGVTTATRWPGPAAGSANMKSPTTDDASHGTWSPLDSRVTACRTRLNASSILRPGTWIAFTSSPV